MVDISQDVTKQNPTQGKEGRVICTAWIEPQTLKGLFNTFLINFIGHESPDTSSIWEFLHLILFCWSGDWKGKGVCQLSESVDMHQGRKVIAGPSSEANRKAVIF